MHSPASSYTLAQNQMEVIRDKANSVSQKEKVKINRIGFVVLLLAASCGKVPKAGYEPWCNDWQILVRDALSGDGKVSASYEGVWHQGDMTPDKYGNRPHFEAVGAHVGILELHPVSPTESAKLRFKGMLASETPILTVIAGGSIHGDCLLECYANGENVGEYVLNGLQWSTCQFDLSAFAGNSVDLELWDTAGGQNKWLFENCFIDDISFAPRQLNR